MASNWSNCQAVYHSAANAGNVDDRPDPVVLAVLVIDVPHGFGDIACRRHGVGLVVSAVDPYPSAFAAHDHGLVFTEACDVGSDDWAASALEGSLLCCLDSLGQDQRVIGDVGELAEDLRLVGALVTPQRTLRSSTGETSSGSSRFWDPFTRVRRGVEGKTVITCQPDPACRSARSVIMGHQGYQSPARAFELVVKASTASKIDFGTPQGSSKDQRIQRMDALKRRLIVISWLAANGDELLPPGPMYHS